MATNTWQDGDLVRVDNQDSTYDGFVDSSSTNVDPTGVTFRYKWTDDSAYTELVYGTDAALVKESTGKYHVDMDTTGKAGQYCHYKWLGTGTGQASARGQFYVEDTDLD